MKKPIQSVFALSILCAMALCVMSLDALAGRNRAGNSHAGPESSKVRVGPQYHFGLSHSALGQAQLMTTGDGSLMVRNIGSSGQDGVSIALNGLRGWRGEIDYGPVSQLSINWRLEVRVQRIELARGIPTEEVAFYYNKISASDIGVGLSATTPPDCVHIELYNDDQLVDAAEFMSPLPQYLVSGPIGSTPAGVPNIEISDSSTGSDQFKRKQTLYFPEDLLVRAGLHPPVFADRVVIGMEGLAPGNPYADSVQVLARDATAGMMLLKQEHVIHRDIAARALGNAHMGGACLPGTGTCGLQVSNIGSSGQDGVRCALPEVNDEVLVLFSNGPNLGGATGKQTEAILQAEVSLDGLPPGTPVTGELRCSGDPGGAGGGGRIAIEYSSSANVQDAVVEVYNQRAFVGSATVPIKPTGPTDLGGVSFTSEFVNGRYVLRAGVPLQRGGAEHFAMSVIFTEPGQFLANGQSVPMFGDEVRVLAAVAARGVTKIDAFSIKCKSIPDIVIDDVQMSVSDAAPVVVAFGIEHEDIGIASAEVSPDGQLVVSNIGSSGQDGVMMHLGEAEGGSFSLGEGLAMDVLQGITYELFGQECDSCPLEAAPDIAMHLTRDVASDDHTATFTFTAVPSPRGSATGTMTLLGEQGQVVASFPYESGEAVAVRTTAGQHLRIKRELLVERERRSGSFRGGDEFERVLVMELDEYPSGAGVTIEHPIYGAHQNIRKGMVIAKPSSSRAFNRMHRLRYAKMRAAADDTVCNPCAFSIDRAGPVIFSNSHTGVGEALLYPERCDDDVLVKNKLYVGGLSFDTSSGVSIDLRDFRDMDDDGDSVPDADEVGRIKVKLPWLGDDVPDFFWTQHINGMVDALPDDVADVSLIPDGAGVKVNVGPVRWMAPESIRVQILDEDGVILDQQDGLSPGDVCSTVVPPQAGTYVFELVVTDSRETSPTGVVHRFVWGASVDMQIPGHSPQHGKEIKIASKSASAARTSVVIAQEAVLTRSGFSSQSMIVIDDEDLKKSESQCPADCVPVSEDGVDIGDGQVTIADVTFALTKFGSSGGRCDIAPDNGDGTWGDSNVTIADITKILTAYGPCPE